MLVFAHHYVGEVWRSPPDIDNIYHIIARIIDALIQYALIASEIKVNTRSVECAYSKIKVNRRSFGCAYSE